MKLYIYTIFCFLVLASTLSAQDNSLIQISGMVVSEHKAEPVGLPYAEVYIKGTNRGGWADQNGFFSIAVQKLDTLVFRYIGFKSAEYVVPDSLYTDRYTIFQILTRDEILLPQTVVYPWPSKEHLRQEFLAMDVTDKMQDEVQKNLAEQTIKKLIEITPADAQASTSLYLQQQASAYYYKGQFKPMNILSPIAWIQFFEAWKRGDFKRKKQ